MTIYTSPRTRRLALVRAGATNSAQDARIIAAIEKIADLAERYQLIEVRAE